MGGISDRHSVSKVNKTAQKEAKTATRRYANALAMVANAFDKMYQAEDRGAARQGSPAHSEAQQLAEAFGNY